MNRFILAALPLAILAGCATSTTPSQIATDANLLATGLSAAITQIAAIPGVNQAEVLTLQADLKTIETDATTIAAATSAPSTSVVQEIDQEVDAIAPIALSLTPGGAAWLPLINAATSLAPILMADLGASGAAPGAVAPVYTPAQARALLAAH